MTDDQTNDDDAPADNEAADDEAAGDELSPEDEHDIERLDTALATLGDDALREGLAGISEKQRQELATSLNLPRATMHLGDALAPLVRRKLRGLPVDRALVVATAITNRTNESTVQALGDRSADPSRADLDEVLPAVVDAHGVELVRLMLASYAVSDAPCRLVMRELLDTDERFALPDAPAADDGEGDELPSFGLVARRPGDDAERTARREQRKVAKEGRRAAAARARAARAAGEASRREALHAAKRSDRGH